MDLSTAISLIDKGVLKEPAQRWADLGAGSGMFTNALVEIVGSGSVIYAVDKSTSGFVKTKNAKNISIEVINDDFTNGLGNLSELDGILMANSLHFVRNKIELIKKLSTHLKSGGRFVIVEYDTDQANTWVPYPVSFNSFDNLIQTNSLGSIQKIGNAASAYQRSGMYSAIIQL